MPDAARTGDSVQHTPLSTLGGVSTNTTVFIGSRSAWRGIDAESVEVLQAAKQETDAAVKDADARARAAAGTPSAPAANARAEAVKKEGLETMSAMITAAAEGSDIHNCRKPMPPVTHGPGVVTTPSETVFLAGKPAARAGDTILEALGPPNRITGGEPTVHIG